ncbi:hypothetical protein [Microbacterium soli]|uniref:Uncharacterized protein n=1 Tax=Microbacterium soli TaxID=446075 RepID=A0ABP7MM19_9MICO
MDARRVRRLGGLHLDRDARRRAETLRARASAPLASQGWETRSCAESLNEDGLDWDAYRLRIAFGHRAITDPDRDALVRALRMPDGRSPRRRRSR